MTVANPWWGCNACLTHSTGTGTASCSTKQWKTPSPLASTEKRGCSRLGRPSQLHRSTLLRHGPRYRRRRPRKFRGGGVWHEPNRARLRHGPHRRHRGGVQRVGGPLHVGVGENCNIPLLESISRAAPFQDKERSWFMMDMDGDGLAERSLGLGHRRRRHARRFRILLFERPRRAQTTTHWKP